ncbi:unnamed protein product [Rotaria sp. Silwood1]|nr:unnamed protein product [Rotaria sp. Silwood1]
MKSKIYSEEVYHSNDHIVKGTAFIPIFYPFNKLKSFQYLSTISPFQTVDDISGMDISQHLERLSLNLWEFETVYFILQYCPNLKELDLIVTIIDPVKLRRRKNLAYLLPTFANSFWLDHNWTVATHENYLYTLPFHFPHFYGFTHF